MYDLGIPFLIAGTKALGLISKFITTPLWVIVEDKKVHILDMNQRYLQLLNYIKDATLNIDAFMCGKLKLYEDVSVKDDAILQALVEPSECDGDCKVVLSIVLPTLAKLVENMYRDHLPGAYMQLMNHYHLKRGDEVRAHQSITSTARQYLAS